MKPKLEPYVWVYGFDRLSLMYDKILSLGGEQNILYKGETKKIPRDLAVDVFDYGYDDLEIYFTSLDEAILQRCPEPYCIIEDLRKKLLKV